MDRAPRTCGEVAAVDKGEMTADEAATKLKEARQRMSGDRR